jgi:hypothetical protein
MFMEDPEVRCQFSPKLIDTFNKIPIKIPDGFLKWKLEKIGCSYF